MAAVTDRLPTRAEVPAEDTWDLASLFPDDAAWEKAFAQWEGMIPRYAEFRGKLGSGPAALAELLTFDVAADRLGDRVGTYAFLRFTEDGANPTVFINNPGFGAEQHLSPYGLAVDPDTGDVYMADTDRRQVDRYSSTGQYLNSLGTNGVVGETPSTLRYPSRVAVHDGLVFVADTWAHRISVWAPNGRTPDGQQQQLWEYKAFGGKDGQFRQPRGMAFDQACPTGRST